MEPLAHRQAFRLPDISGHGCGTAPDFDRLPLLVSNIDLDRHDGGTGKSSRTRRSADP
jgi:hypothetical protein